MSSPTTEALAFGLLEWADGVRVCLFCSVAPLISERECVCWNGWPLAPPSPPHLHCSHSIPAPISQLTVNNGHYATAGGF